MAVILIGRMPDKCKKILRQPPLQQFVTNALVRHTGCLQFGPTMASTLEENQA
jgi:hypothetical protein